MKTVLVTGAAGFIGSHLIDRLVLDGHKVIGLDKFSHGIEEHIFSHKHKKLCTYFRTDVTDIESLKPEYFKGVDWVFHLAGVSKTALSLVDPLQFHRVNVDGTLNILERCRRAKTKRFIYAASSSCYGQPDVNPVDESAATRLNTPYALTKYLGEQCVLHWGKVYGMGVVSLRLFSVYGGKNRAHGGYGAIVTHFMEQKAVEGKITIYGDGKQQKDMVYISDVVDAFVKSAASTVQNEILNVGAGIPARINEISALIGGPVVFVPKTQGFSECAWADISKIKKVLKWKPRMTVESGINTIINL